jgi:hypothetical protein
MKVIVLMTDGLITPKFRLKDNNYSPDLDPNGKLNQSSKDTHKWLLSVCNAAKTSGITVFTIGFEIKSTDAAATDMRDCASSPGHFYVATGTGMAPRNSNLRSWHRSSFRSSSRPSKPDGS